MSQKNPSESEAKALETVWLEHNELHASVDNVRQFKLAMAFCQLANPSSAEAIFQNLYKGQEKPANLGVLARKLALAYQALKNNGKAQHYEQLAESLV